MFQSFPGLVVEVPNGDGDVGDSSCLEVDEEGLNAESGSVVSGWLAVNSSEQLEQLMVS